MATLSQLQILNDPSEHKKILSKLPRQIQERWLRVIDHQIHGHESTRADSTDAQQGEYPPFTEFCKFIAREARIACSPFNQKSDDTKKEEMNPKRPPKPSHARSFASKTAEVFSSTASRSASNGGGPTKPPDVRAPCALCKNQHSLDSCSTFKAMNLSDRLDFIKKRGLCLGCLRWGHRRRDCRNKRHCSKCERNHPTLLHDDSYSTPVPEAGKVSPADKDMKVQSSTAHRTETSNIGQNCSHTLIVPVLLHHQDDPQNNVIVYALLDEHADSCFIAESVLDDLGVSGEEVQLKLSTILGRGTVSSKKINGLTVKGLTESSEIAIPVVYSRPSINANHSQIPRSDSVKKWPHLKEVAKLLPPYLKGTEIGLLIGCNCTQALRPRDIVHGKDEEPYAIRTVLGWGVVGVMHRSNDDHDHTCGFSTTASEGQCHFAFRTQVKEVSPLQVSKMFELDFNERATEEKTSVEDRRFLQKMKEGIHTRDDGHFEMPLPLKNDDIKLPNNRKMAAKRLMKLKTRLTNDPKYREDYKAFMKDIVDKGYAERVPENELSLEDGSVWYTPHHGVYNPKKPGKIRVVFDCSAEFEGEVLNRHLLQGPDLTNNLVGVLCRFHKEPVAFTCDIEGMFHQVGVYVKHRNLLRFLWWEDGKLDKPPVEYRMTVHLFGATSSPGCANLALKSAADAYENSCGKKAADFVKKDFYVDDGLKSVATRDEALQLIENSRHLCEKGGFHLHKYVSNDKEVLNAIPAHERAKDIQNIDVFQDDLPMERTLGVQWFIESDTFHFRVQLQDKPLTRRGILSTVISIFDPLGLVAPVLLIGKCILQVLCRDGCSWDDPVSESTRAQWEKWRYDIQKLSSLEVPRCFKPENFGDIKSAELHNFSDASLEGYGQCSYLRLTDSKGNVSSSLVMGKSRVTPSKPITVPRLELTAAVTSVKVGTFLVKELEYSELTQLFYTDSKVVLGYICNETKRFHIFVANRVQKIRDYTSPADWRHIGTNSNPADLASRGLSAQELIDSNLWWKGPGFLSTTETPLPIAECVELNTDDPEVKKVSAFHVEAAATDFSSMTDRFHLFSSWFHLRRAVAGCLRFIEKLRERSTKRPTFPINRQLLEDQMVTYVPVTVQEMQQAERVIVKLVQAEAFPKEIHTLSRSASGDTSERKQSQSHEQVSKNSPLCMLDPVLDDNNLLRVGGRIKRAAVPEDVKHPILLPRHGHVSSLVIEHYHVQSCHPGRGMTLNAIRQAGFWIVGARAAVTSHVWKCVMCRKLRGAPCGQKMSDLPHDRLDPTPPFTYSAVDYFGPFLVKEGRKELKRWGVIFTCMSSRAVHIETSNSLSTDSFLNAYRRFVCRRGPVRQLRCDRGTNFIGGKNELDAALEEMNNQKISRELLKDSCDWVVFKMNVPHASHMAGAWERMIRSTRNALSALLKQHGQQLDDELLRTLMTEAEAIVNSRPLTYTDMKSPDSLEPLSPSQLLTQKTKVVLPPPGVFVRQDLYCRRRWRRVQFLANEFWSRWKSEYLPTLQERKKWTRPKRNLGEGDIVMMMDDSLPRCRWPLARVIETYPGLDGYTRKVKLQVGTSFFERPVHKLVLLMHRGIPDEEPDDEEPDDKEPDDK